MNAATQAADVLRQTEATLRDLVSKAASSGDYPAVVQIASWAQTLSDLIKKPPSPAAAPFARTVPAKEPAKKKPARKQDYPKFFRQGDQLIRVAWSKKEKKEYQHKAPHSVLRAVVTAIAEAGNKGQIFPSDSILPLSDTDGTEIPNYQAYLGISLLKHLELIRQHGRQGYSVPAPAGLSNATDSTWANLPQK